MSIYWIILFLVLLFIELATVNLVSIWFSVGALAAFVTSFFTDSALIQLLVFVVVSIVALFITAPLVEKLRKKEKVVPTNLDRVIGKRAEVVKEIKEERGLSILFISHDLGVINYLCDRVAVMKDGRIIEAGDRRSFFEAPKTEYGRELLSSVPRL